MCLNQTSLFDRTNIQLISLYTRPILQDDNSMTNDFGEGPGGMLLGILEFSVGTSQV